MMQQKRALNSMQKKAVTTTEGPVLIIAGPGSGKTHTLVERIIYLIETKHVKPEEVLLATFTEKAAKELQTRVSNPLNEKIP
jgi:DNA helicase-2/ATP-dependent DNA helicase PcrA